MFQIMFWLYVGNPSYGETIKRDTGAMATKKNITPYGFESRFWKEGLSRFVILTASTGPWWWKMQVELFFNPITCGPNFSGKLWKSSWSFLISMACCTRCFIPDGEYLLHCREWQEDHSVVWCSVLSCGHLSSTQATIQNRVDLRCDSRFTFCRWQVVLEPSYNKTSRSLDIMIEC